MLCACSTDVLPTSRLHALCLVVRTISTFAACPCAIRLSQQAISVCATLLRAAILNNLNVVAAFLFALLEDGRVMLAAAEELPEAAAHV